MSFVLIFFATILSAAVPVKKQKSTQPPARPLASPIECFEAARTQTDLTTDQTSRLCRCALSTTAVDCYLDGKWQTPLEDDQIVDLCVGRQRAYRWDCDELARGRMPKSAR